MIDEVDRQLKTWVDAVLRGVDVSLAAPLDKTTGTGVSLYLFRVTKASAARRGHQPEEAP